jgi:predicted N-acetyltransferase YhbS
VPVQPFGADDLPAAAALLEREGWGFTPKELARLLATAPGLGTAAYEDGQLVGLVMVARHGQLAWVGNVAVAPEHRAKGLGEGLVAEALRRIDLAGIPTTKLCSVPRAETLYRRHGFRDEGPVHTHALHHERPTHRPREAEVLLPDALPEMLALDRPRFGADRSTLLRLLLRDYPDTVVGVREQGRLAGFGFLKPGSAGSEVGPVVLARPDPGLASLILDGVLAFRLEGHAAAVECSVPGAHPFMAKLLKERGFDRQDGKLLMQRGVPLAQDLVGCAALGGLEKG